MLSYLIVVVRLKKGEFNSVNNSSHRTTVVEKRYKRFVGFLSFKKFFNYDALLCAIPT